MSDYSAMSSLSDQMENMISTHTLPSRRGSEIGSSYQMESGLFITSFAATLFIASAITIVILFITLVTTLTVMLQSCESSYGGLIQHHDTSDHYNYCRIFALHAELNNLELDEFPSICKEHVIQHIKQDQYLRDLNWTMLVVNSYFNGLKPHTDGLDAVLMDVDDVLTSNSPYKARSLQYRFNQSGESSQVVKDKFQVGLHFLELHSKLHTRGWSLIFVSRKPERLRNETIETLNSYGYGSWSTLIMRSDDEMIMESWEYFSRKRTELQNQGFRITSVISSRMDALTGPCLGKRVFKLPKLLNYGLEHHVKNLKLS